jgi:hypothetical protein
MNTNELNQLKATVASFNGVFNMMWPGVGGFDIHTVKEYMAITFTPDLKDFNDMIPSKVPMVETDIILHYDFCTDDLKLNSETEMFGHLFGTVIDQLISDIQLPGQRTGVCSEIADFDGSGNGLWYGCTVYRF